MHRLSDFFDHVERDGGFRQTQFANSPQPASICFVASDKYLRQVNDNPAITCVVATEDMAGSVSKERGVAVSSEPEKHFYQLHNRLVLEFGMRPELDAGIHPSARLHPTAHVDDDVAIGPEVEIGPGAVVLSGSVLERGVLVGPNAVVGADGHFYKRYDGHLFRVLHAGGVLLEQGAQVLAGGVVSKALHTDFTQVGRESVISIKAHVGHGGRIGARCIIAGNAQISGYTRLEDDVWVGPSATVGNLLKIGRGVNIEVGSVAIEDIDAEKRVSGNFAIDHRSNMMEFARKRRGR